MQKRIFRSLYIPSDLFDKIIAEKEHKQLRSFNATVVSILSAYFGGGFELRGSAPAQTAEKRTISDFASSEPIKRHLIDGEMYTDDEAAEIMRKKFANPAESE